VSETVTLYVDYRSPYSYLAKEDAYELEDDFDVVVDWLPYYTDLVGAYGGTVETRPPMGWTKVKYLYMDCRRLANRRGLVIRGTQKIYDPTLVSIGMLYAKEHGVFRAYHDYLLPLFWNREFDIENAESIEEALTQAGAPREGFGAYRHGRGKALFDRVQQQGVSVGVFGVPTFVYRGELFWGTDRVWLLRETLEPLRRV
jgi:2-hydroxychromene-2-carboxylate isomerase